MKDKGLSVADVFDALTYDRVYRKAMKGKDALDIMEGESGTHFDPYLLKIFSKEIRNEKKYSVCG